MYPGRWCGSAWRAPSADPIDWEQPLRDRVALVTGAGRGIGKAIAEVLARDGAHVVCLDMPGAGDELEAVADAIGGSTLTVDIAGEQAPATIASRLLDEHGGVDVVVHNAGVTRDKTLGRMTEDQWDMVLAINLVAPRGSTASCSVATPCASTAGSCACRRSAESAATPARPTTRPRRRA